MIILNFWIIKLSDSDQGIHKHAIQKRDFQRFWKKYVSDKKKSQCYRIHDYVMHTKI